MNRAELRRVKRHVMSWGTGTRRPLGGDVFDAGAATIGLADGRHLPEVVASGLVGPGTVVLVPAGSGHGGTEGVVEYDGSLADPGADLSIDDDFFLQTQDYVSAAFMSVLGPTLLRITDGEDLRAYCADLDRALNEGRFPDVVVAPAVRIADVPALGGDHGADGPELRLHVDHTGKISTSPSGRGLGEVGQSLTVLAEAHRAFDAAAPAGDAVCLGGVVEDGDRVAELSARPFAGRYLAVLEALQVMTANEVERVRVSGFAHRLTPGLPVAADTPDLLRPDAPVVMWNDETCFVAAADAEGGTGYTIFGVDRLCAQAVECLMVAGDAAVEYLPAGIITQVRGWFADHGVSLGADLPVAVGAR